MPTTLTTIGGDLYRVALDQFGDATQWWRIAAANGLTDPVLAGQVTLVIPDAAPALDGLPPQ